ncbi:DNA-directed RNA polymerase subunit RPC12/RpoP [Paraburkholderia sp. GAS82]
MQVVAHFFPRSDVLIPGLDIRTHCPRCGAKELVRRKPTFWESFSSRFKEIVGS